MEEVTERPIALDSYEELADAYSAKVDTKDYNAHYEWPATISLMPEVTGRRALDAACGPGRYAEWLVNNGAEVTAFDVAPRMLANARKRLGTRVRIERADLSQPLRFLSEATFDLVVCALALDYVRDWRPTLSEFRRVLRRPGLLIFSVEHPLSEDSLSAAGDYFQTELVEYTFRQFGAPVVVPTYRRPLMDVFNALSESGFFIDRVVEPLPTAEFKEQNPADYEELLRQPSFLCIRAGTSSRG
jgi:ubiquinone/menaquinone biosynthesis C-methylase UbiE